MTQPRVLKTERNMGLLARALKVAGSSFNSFFHHEGTSRSGKLMTAPFKRNDQLLEAMPKGLIACPGTGIENLVDKAKRLGIPVKRLGSR